MKSIQSFFLHDPAILFEHLIAVRHSKRQRRQVHRDRTTEIFLSSPSPPILLLRSLPLASDYGTAWVSGFVRQPPSLPCSPSLRRVSVRVSRLGEIPLGCGATKDRRRDWEQGRRERSSNRRFSIEQEIARIRPSISFLIMWNTWVTILLLNYLDNIIKVFLKIILYNSYNSEMKQ